MAFLTGRSLHFLLVLGIVLSGCRAEDEGASALKRELDSFKSVARESAAKIQSLEQELARNHKELATTRQQVISMQTELQRAQAKAATADRMEVKAVSLETEVAQLREALHAAKHQWLPIWSNPHFDRFVAPAVVYYHQEVKSGKAMDQAKARAREAYLKGREVLGPTLHAIYVKWRQLVAVVEREWRKEQYKPVRGVVEQVAGRAQAVTAKSRAQLNAVVKHQKVKQARAQMSAQLMRLEKDLHRMLTHALKADVPGSGMDAEFIQSLVRAILYGFPIMVLVYLLGGMLGRLRGSPRVAQPQSAGMSRAQKKPRSKIK